MAEEEMIRSVLPPGVSSILAPNPSLMTGPGTNSFVIHEPDNTAVVIDPGPNIDEHLRRIVQEAGGKVSAVLITHGHPDHAEGAVRLRELTGAPILAWSREGMPYVDELLADGELIKVGSRRLQVLHTPGHRFDHLCFLLGDREAVFAGDLLAGSGTVVIAPPEGNLTDYLTSLQRLIEVDPKIIFPGHGPTITDPRERLRDYVSHRYEREQQVLSRLAEGPAALDALVEHIYADVDPGLHAMAALSLTAHLYKLETEGRVARPRGSGSSGPWNLIG